MCKLPSGLCALCDAFLLRVVRRCSSPRLFVFLMLVLLWSAMIVSVRRTGVAKRYTATNPKKVPCRSLFFGSQSVAIDRPRLVKQATVGTGAAEKVQVHAMVQRLLPGAKIAGPDAADALAVAITHAHHLATSTRIPLPAKGGVRAG